MTAENEADANLFKNGLILDAKTLEYLLSRHDNAAFRIMGAQYAKEREWKGFEYVSCEDKAKEYVETVFQGLKNAAKDLNGYSALQYLGTKGEYTRLADELEIRTEFDKSDGKYIDNAIVETSN